MEVHGPNYFERERPNKSKSYPKETDPTKDKRVGTRRSLIDLLRRSRSDLSSRSKSSSGHGESSRKDSDNHRSRAGTHDRRDVEKREKYKEAKRYRAVEDYAARSSNPRPSSIPNNQPAASDWQVHSNAIKKTQHERPPLKRRNALPRTNAEDWNPELIRALTPLTLAQTHIMPPKLEASAHYPEHPVKRPAKPRINDAKPVRTSRKKRHPQPPKTRTPPWLLNVVSTPSLSKRRTRPEHYGWTYGHHKLGASDENPLITLNFLGHGSVGIVEEVRLRNTDFPAFVRKRVQIPVRQRHSRLNIIQEEARNLQSLSHAHIITILGSYEDVKQNSRHFYSLLMCPVGDHDLRNFLDMVGEQKIMRTEWRAWIQRWFICLASALSYMHDQGIRHQDIKPSNIIHRGGRVLFTDFSSSSCFEVGHTTSTDNPARASPMYAAPEVLSRNGRLQKHGRGSDIFSLGCVFCEMLAVLEGSSVASFQDDLLKSSSSLEPSDDDARRNLRYSQRLDQIRAWLANSKFFFDCISPMLNANRTTRPNAATVLKTILANKPQRTSCTCVTVNQLAAKIPYKAYATLSTKAAIWNTKQQSRIGIDWQDELVIRAHKASGFDPAPKGKNYMSSATKRFLDRERSNLDVPEWWWAQRKQHEMQPDMLIEAFATRLIQSSDG